MQKCTYQGPRKSAKIAAVQETKQEPGVCERKITTDKPNYKKTDQLGDSL